MTIGVDIDMGKKQLREYSRIPGKKWGKWISLEKYPFITVIKLHKRITHGMTVGRFSIQHLSHGNDIYEICILNQTHYKRITIDISEDYKTAEDKAEELAKRLGLEKTVFSPLKISKRR